MNTFVSMRVVLMYAFFVFVSVLMISMSQDEKELSEVECAASFSLNLDIEAVIPELRLTNNLFFSAPGLSRLITAILFEINPHRQDKQAIITLKNYLTNTLDLKILTLKPFRQRVLSSSEEKDNYHLA